METADVRYSAVADSHPVCYPAKLDMNNRPQAGNDSFFFPMLAKSTEAN